MAHFKNLISDQNIIRNCISYTRKLLCKISENECTNPSNKTDISVGLDLQTELYAI